MVNQTIDLNYIQNQISFIPRYLADNIVSILSSQGISVSVRFVSLLLFTLSLLLIYIGIKITTPLIKYTLIVLSLILLVGLFIPGW